MNNPSVLYVPVHRDGHRGLPREFKTVALAWIITTQSNPDDWHVESVAVEVEKEVAS